MNTTNGLVQAIEALNKDYLRRYPSEAARAAGQMAPADIVERLARLSLSELLEVWQQLPLDMAAEILPLLPDSLVKQLLTRGDPVQAARLLARLSPERHDRYGDLLDGLKRQELQHLGRYADDSAGALMDTRFLVLHDDMTVREAQQRLRKSKPNFTRLLFTVDADGRLHNLVDIHDLALADISEPLRTFAKPVPTMVLPTTDRAEVVELLERHRLTDLPVADFDGKLIGVIRYDTLMAAVREESIQDIQTMVGVSKDERALSKVLFVVGKRLPWLHINLVTAFIAAAVVGLFENVIAQFTALAVLLPVVAGQSGNTGAQALAVTMRGLALREIGTSQWRRVVRKEIAVGLINGIAIALVTAIGVYVWSASSGLALVIGLSMVIAMAAAGVAGVLTPIVLTMLRQDPAQSSSIILTTITDVTGFFSFLGIASLLITLL